MARKDKEHDSFVLVERALEEIRAGKMVILTDDEDRENEGDLVMAAEKVTPQAVNFMATHGRGLICLSLTEERIRRLNLPLMVQENTSSFGTAFTVSIEASRGVTTGISAADRATTILAAVAKNAKPADLARPGHIFPLRARDGGVLVRSGQTEGSVDLARMAGLFPAGVICEIMNPDGTMARRAELLRVARKHRLTMLSVADIIRYRLRHDRLVRRVSEATVNRAGAGTFRAITYQSDVDSSVHVAMVKGQPHKGEPVLTRVHRACLVGDVLGSSECGCGRQLDQAFRRIAEEGTGVVVYLQKDSAPENRLVCTHLTAEERGEGGQGKRLREFGVGAQILRDLGLQRLRLLAQNPKKIIGLESYQLEVVDQEPLVQPKAPRAAAKDVGTRTRARRKDRKIPVGR